MNMHWEWERQNGRKYFQKVNPSYNTTYKDSTLSNREVLVMEISYNGE